MALTATRTRDPRHNELVEDVERWQDLIEEYGRLQRLDGHTPQSRGQRFNYAIRDMLNTWGISAQASVRGKGEVDVTFTSEGTRYVVEAKWEQRKSDTGTIAKLQKRVRQRLAGTYGIILSMSGYSDEALSEVTDGERLEVLLLDRSHFEAMLSGLVTPQELLSLIHDRAAFHGEAYTQLADLVAPADPPPQLIFGAPGSLTGDVMANPVDCLKAEVVLSGIESRQMGISIGQEGRLFVTTDQGILAVDTARRTIDSAASVTDCHGNVILEQDGGITFARHYGVGRLYEGKIEVLAGGFSGSTRLLRHPDGSDWVFDNGSSHPLGEVSISRLGSRFGEKRKRHTLKYPATSTTGAAWLNDTEVLVSGNTDLSILSIVNGKPNNRISLPTNPCGVIALSESSAVTAGNTGVLFFADFRTGIHGKFASFSLGGSVGEFAASTDDSIYVASHYENERKYIYAITRLYSSTANLAEAIAEILQRFKTGNSSVGHTGDYEPQEPYSVVANSEPAYQTATPQISRLVHRDSSVTHVQTVDISRMGTEGCNSNEISGGRSKFDALLRVTIWCAVIFFGIMESGAIGAAVTGGYPSMAGAIVGNVLFALLFGVSVVALVLHKRRRNRKAG